MTHSTKQNKNEQLLQPIQNMNAEQYNNLEIAPGVSYSHTRLANETLIESAHMLEIDVANPYTQLKVLSPERKVGKLGKVRDIMKSVNYNDHENLVMAVNGDFFSHLGIPSGLQISEGEIITAPKHTKVAMVLKDNRSVALTENIEMKATVNLANAKITIDAINRTRRLKDDDHLFLYNTRFRESTKTPVGGVEIVIALNDKADARLVPKQVIQGQVKTNEATANTPIQDGYLVLSATGSKAKWIKKHLTIGTKLSINIGFTNDVNQATEVISGNSTLAYTLLRSGEINREILNDENPYNVHRHPRTMLATKNKKLYIFIIDGRQPGHSDGITMAEGAQYLRSIGMTDAINIDGGGSTTCFIRKAGDYEPTLVNRPSDGFEREVGNVLVLTSAAPITDLEKIVPMQGSYLKLMIDSEIDIEVKGHDKHINALPLSGKDVSWRVNGNIGTINDNGRFRATTQVSSGEIIVQKDDIIEKVSVQITNEISRLKISPERIVIEPGKSIRFTVTAYDKAGSKVWISPNQFSWEVTGDIGEIDHDGHFRACESILRGQIIAKFNGIKTISKVNIGQQPEVITGFETIENMLITHNQTVPKSVQFTKVERPNPVRFGRFSGKLTYDFTGMSGTSKATINFFGEQGKEGHLVKGRPYRFGIWVYGDSNNHWLRIGVADANGETQSLNFTAIGGLNWTGWKYVYANIPNTFSYPIKVLTLYLIETSDANKNSGVVYFDNLRAEYIPLNEDVKGPLFSDYEPKPNGIVNKNDAVNVSVCIKDLESGVDPSSVRMWINDQGVECTFNPSTGIASHQMNVRDLCATNKVVVEAIDNAGNPSVPKAEWAFFI